MQRQRTILGKSANIKGHTSNTSRFLTHQCRQLDPIYAATIPLLSAYLKAVWYNRLDLASVLRA